MKCLAENLFVITEIFPDEVVAENNSGKTIKVLKNRLPKCFEAGDLIRHCEHGYYDIIDADGDFVYSKYHN